MNSSKPLDNFPLIRSSDVEEVRRSLATVYANSTLVPAHGVAGFNATINDCQLRDIGFCYGTFGAAVGFEFPATGFFCQLFPIGGRSEVVIGEMSTELIGTTGAVISSEVPHQTNISAEYEHLVLRINAQALTRKLAAMTGATLSKPLQINPRQTLRHPAARMLLQYIPLLADVLSSAAPPFPDWWITQTEELVMTLFLCGHQHNYSHLLEADPSDAAPAQIRRAEDYIAANLHRPVTLEELANFTGVSAFSLFSTFKKHRGYSPLEFVNRLRSKLGKPQ